MYSAVFYELVYLLDEDYYLLDWTKYKLLQRENKLSFCETVVWLL